MTYAKLHKRHHSSRFKHIPRLHILPNHPKTRVMLELVSSVVVLVLGFVFAVLAIDDLRYGMQLPLFELGIDDIQSFMSNVPWLSAVLSVVCFAFGISLILKALDVINFKQSMTNHSKVNRPAALAVMTIIPAMLSVGFFTNIDNTLTQSGEFSSLRTFNSFVTKHVIVGVVEQMTKDTIVVRDSTGQRFEIKTNTRTISNEITDQPVEVGTEIAIHTQTPRKALLADTTSQSEVVEGAKSLIVSEATPVVTDPGFPDPTPDPATAIADAPEGKVGIRIRARGQEGVEKMQLKIKDKLIKEWVLTEDYAEYGHNHNESVGDKDIKVTFTNDYYKDGIDNNVQVDYIKVGGTTFQSEDQSVYSVGSWTSATGCAGGNKQSEWLYCNGYLQYAIGDAGKRSTDTPTPTPAPAPSPTPTPEEPAPTPEPAPAPAEVVSIRIRAKGQEGGEKIQLSIKDTVVREWILGTEFINYTYSH